MSALSIQPTYPIFTETDGQPLEDGYIWIGQANLDPQVNPINVFWDAALTIPAGQPIRTLGGYPSNSGTPARLYVNSDYSIRVMNKNGSVVYSAPAATERYSEVVVSGTDAGNVTFDQSASYPQGSAGLALQSVINVKNAPFNAVGDGVADDTVAIHAAIDAAKAIDGAVYFPAGKYRVTSGYTNSSTDSVLMFGESLDYTANTANNVEGSCILLDSADPNSFFYHQSAGNQLTVNNLQFACAQYVLDRKFFVQSSSSVKHVFDNVHFVAVERPFVYLAGTYFQLSTYRNIRFTNSGSFHSTTTSLIATFMLIENCDVEGAMPANTEKVICKLTGVRQLQATNFSIEPSVPSTGWIALFLQNDYDSDWVRFPTATFRGFWIEVTGNPLLYSVYQVNGRSLFLAPVLNNGAASPFRLDDMAAVEFYDTTFSGTTDPLQNYFFLNSYTCQVKLVNCNYRVPGTAINDPRFTFDNCSNSPAGGVGNEPFSATSHNNQQSELLWAFDGGYPDPGKVLAQAFGGTTIVPTVDAAFGRGLYINPNAGALSAYFQGRLRGSFPQGGQMFVVVRGTLPNIPSGSLEMNFLFNGVNIGGGKIWTPADSFTDFQLALPVTAQTVNPTTMGVRFNGSADTAALKLYQLELWIGKSLPSVTMPSFPQNVITFAAATPAAGEWARGDIIWNNTPSAGGTPGWVCTTGGTPGTWKAMANLAP